MTAVYERNELTWDQEELDQLLAEGRAKAFPTPKGTHYVVKVDGRSFGVRPDQVVAAPVESLLPDPEHLSYLRQVIQSDSESDDLQYLLDKAEAEGISVDEYTDGEYTVVDGKVVEALAVIRSREDDLLSKFF